MYRSSSNIAVGDDAIRMEHASDQLSKQYAKVITELELFESKMEALSWTGTFANEIRAELTAALSKVRADNLHLVEPISAKLNKHATWLRGERARLKIVENDARTKIGWQAALNGQKYDGWPPEYSWSWDGFEAKVETILGVEK